MWVWRMHKLFYKIQLHGQLIWEMEVGMGKPLHWKWDVILKTQDLYNLKNLALIQIASRNSFAWKYFDLFSNGEFRFE